MTDTTWKAFSLTHVEYPEGDSLGHLLAIISLLPVAIIVGFITLILFRRDLHTIVFFIGCLLSEAVSVSLKKIIAEPRPMTKRVLYTEYGMPSSHSQMMWFFTSYSVLFLILRLKHINNSVMEIVWKVLMGVSIATTAAVVGYSRVYLLYHTWSQIIWGAVLGMVLGISWFTFTHLVLSPVFPVVASWRISEQLMIRDTSLIPNIMWFEYTHARTENRTRSRKLTSMKSQ
ncbi:Dolichyldiphosphatase 1 [Halocaridina rubra]|uniref:Dolichyldiphosphatase n=1 Tax=Halocaridina rubra TaxID=373956 RepID=A0AAN8XK48_HALRR